MAAAAWFVSPLFPCLASGVINGASGRIGIHCVPTSLKYGPSCLQWFSYSRVPDSEAGEDKCAGSGHRLFLEERGRIEGGAHLGSLLRD